MTILRKGVSLGLGGTTGSAPGQTFQNNAAFYGPVSSFGTNTGWTRIWADWPTLQPTASTPLGQNFGSLDSQVQAANAAGLGVIIVAARTPTWAGSSTDEPTGVKKAAYHFPNDHTTTGPWAQFIQFLLLRYCGPSSPTSQGLAIFLEICNEPNNESWPQRANGPPPNNVYGAGGVISGCVAAQLLDSAQAIHNGLGIFWPLILAPATSDTLLSGVETTPYSTFTDQVLSTLQSMNFVASPTTAWSHHCYTDVENARTGTPQSNPSNYCLARDVRSRLIQNSWAGWQGASGETPPLILLTEGGTRWQKIRQIYGNLPDTTVETIQASLLDGAHNRYANTADGTGIALFTNYLFYTDPNFDTGLLYAYNPPTNHVRAAYNTWAGFPNP